MESLNKRQIQLKASFLGSKQPCDGYGIPAAITAFPPEAAMVGTNHDTIRKGHWLQRDLVRAIGVAKRSRLPGYRIEIAPDGTIAIVVGSTFEKHHARRSR